MERDPLESPLDRLKRLRDRALYDSPRAQDERLFAAQRADGAKYGHGHQYDPKVRCVQQAAADTIVATYEAAIAIIEASK